MANPKHIVSTARNDYGSTTFIKNSSLNENENNDDTFSSQNVLGYQSLPHTSSASLFRRTDRQNSFVVFPSRFSRMSVDTMPNSEIRQITQRLEYFLNVINQICIGFVTIYMSWLCLRMGLSGTALHAWLVTIGFSLLMAEGIMCHYSGNVLTFNYKRTTKTTIHWVLQALGGGCGVAGVIIKIAQKGLYLNSTHSKLGFAAFILCLVSMLSGLTALFSTSIKKMLSPLLNKSFHNLIGIAAFVIALLAQYYGYQTGFFSRKVDTDFQILMKVVTLVLLVLTCIGPLKALYHKFSNIVRHFS